MSQIGEINLSLFQYSREQMKTADSYGSIDIDDIDFLESGFIQAKDMKQAIQKVKKTFKDLKFEEHFDEVHYYFNRLFVLFGYDGEYEAGKLASDYIEIHEGEMVDRHGFGHKEFVDYNEHGSVNY